MIQSDCGLVLRPICLISSATSACLLSEHAPLQQRQTINTHTCKKKCKKATKESRSRIFPLPWNKRRGNQEQFGCLKANPQTGSSFYVLTCRESYRSAVKYSEPISPAPSFLNFPIHMQMDIINRRKKGRALEGKWIHYIPHLICSLMEDVSCNREPPTVPGIISNRIALKWAELSLIFLWTKSE